MIVIYGLPPENYSACPREIVFNGGCVRLDLVNRLSGHQLASAISGISGISGVSLAPVLLAL
jgi:hypothetical protein